MANSIITVQGDGVTTQYPLNFTLGILSRDYVTCRVGSEVDGLGAPVYRNLEWITDGLVNIQGAVPGNGVQIVFTRTVPKDELQHNYSNGVPITEDNLDESNLQTMMAIHEFLDGRIGDGFSENLSMNNSKITDLGDATDPTDAVNLQQLEDMTGNAPAYASAAAASAASALSNKLLTDANVTATANKVLEAEAARDAAQAAANGMKWRAPVRVATSANITLSGTQTIDSVAVIAGDRVLVRAQSTASQNGVYIVAAGAWSRATDADAWSELVSQVVTVEEGTTFADTVHICTVNSGGTLGSTAVTWVQLDQPIPDGSLSFLKLASSALASLSDIASGVANKLVTAANFLPALAAALGVSKTFVSAEQSITVGGSLTIPHGLGATPYEVIGWLVCKTAEGGYSVNDVYTLTTGASVLSNTVTYGMGFSCVPDSTNLNIRYGNLASSAFSILNKTTGAGFNITPANWRLVIRARA